MYFSWTIMYVYVTDKVQPGSWLFGTKNNIRSFVTKKTTSFKLCLVAVCVKLDPFTLAFSSFSKWQVSERQEWSLFYLYIWICQAVIVCWYLHNQDHVQFVAIYIYVDYGMFFLGRWTLSFHANFAQWYPQLTIIIHLYQS